MCGDIKEKLRHLCNEPVFAVSCLDDDVLEAPEERARRFALRCCLKGEYVVLPADIAKAMSLTVDAIENIATEAAAIAWQFIRDEVRARHTINGDNE